MFRNRFLADVSISTAQVILNQLTGIVVFFILTGYLSKASLGQINWAIAVLTVALSVLGFGLEHIAVKKTATGEDIGSLLQSYLAHAIIISLGLLLFVWFAVYRFHWLNSEGNFFFWLTLAQCIGFLAFPFRHIANGLEKFRVFFWMSSCANTVKLLLLLILVCWSDVTLHQIVVVYLFASIAELLVCGLLYKVKLSLPLHAGFNGRRYILFIREALPQMGITVFNTAMARMDWIMLGILSSATMVADYSVTNKIFELSTLPLLVLAPVIFPKIAKMFGDNNSLVSGAVKTDYLRILLKLEIVLAVYIAMLINLCWKDILEPLTGGKYGASTVRIIFIMSFAMPLLYINNVFWSLLFAQQQMRRLLILFFCSFLVNLLSDILLIPLFQANGAAMGYVLALLTQTLLYAWFTPSSLLRRTASQVIPVMLAALACGLLADRFFDFFIWKCMAASAGYVLLMGLTGQLRYTSLKQAKKILVI